MYNLPKIFKKETIRIIRIRAIRFIRVRAFQVLTSLDNIREPMISFCELISGRQHMHPHFLFPIS